MQKGILKYTAIIGLLLLVVLGSAFYFFYPGVVFPLVERHTGANIAYSSCEGWPFRKATVRGLRISPDEHDLVLSAEKAVFRVDLRNILRDRGLKAECDLAGVSIAFAGGEEVPGGSAGIMNVILDPGRRYRTVSMNLFISSSLYEVSDFLAVSEDIRIEGQSRFDRIKDNLDLDLGIMFSADLVAGLPDTVKGNILTLQQDGWYGTVIDFKGNPLLLSALYSVASEAGDS
jgi:hypothetical protein